MYSGVLPVFQPTLNLEEVDLEIATKWEWGCDTRAGYTKHIHITYFIEGLSDFGDLPVPSL